MEEKKKKNGRFSSLYAGVNTIDRGHWLETGDVNAMYFQGRMNGRVVCRWLPTFCPRNYLPVYIPYRRVTRGIYYRDEEEISTGGEGRIGEKLLSLSVC